MHLDMMSASSVLRSPLIHLYSYCRIYSVADCKAQKKSAELTIHSRRYSQYLKSRKISLHPYHNTYVYKHRCRQLTLRDFK